ncbi:unnamed protein product [Somion occarium]|uniref:Uncharacterized protein n=1 Tax=Somion occarium TaxID=3059160 RepID=A0ABP1CVI9_9APHY
MRAAVSQEVRFSERADHLGSPGIYPSELLTCENLSPSDIKRHATKIIRLVEHSRTTLTRSGLVLNSPASCQTGFSPFKKAYFDLLLMLKRIRHHIDDKELQRRIDRLSFDMRPPSLEFPNSPSGVRHTPYRIPSGLRQRSPQSEEEDRKMMPPPSILPNMDKRRHLRHSTSSLRCQARDPLRGRPRKRPMLGSDGESSDEEPDTSDDEDDERMIESEDEDDEEEQTPVSYQPPRARLGILCTKRQPVHCMRS